MSIEQKIAEILAESNNLKDHDEVVIEEDAEVVSEATDINDPSDGSEENPANKKNNVNKQEIGGKSKTANVVTKGASAPEASHLSASIKEDVAALIDGEQLTEEFKQKAATIFEAAVINRVKEEVARLDEAYEQAFVEQLSEQVEEIKEGLVEKVNGYLDYVVEQWIEQNEIALESGMKSEILEQFVGGLKSLFEQHYIDVPEEKFDVLDAMETEVAELHSKLDEQVAVNIDLNKKITAYQAAAVVDQLSEGLVETDKEKFVTLVEELEFEGIETFKKKAQTIRESYFTSKGTTKVVQSVVTDEPVVLSEEKVFAAPQMKSYLSALDKLVK